MKRIIRAAALLAAAAIMLSASGCRLDALSAENMMTPPEAFGDGAEIQQAMELELGTQITLRYPRSGEYRSAVVRADVDNDELDEAIVFYRPATDSAGAHMVLLDTDEDGRWSVTDEFSDADGEIDCVEFGDMDHDGLLDIITGWSAYSDYGTLYIHSCREGALSLIPFDNSEDGIGARALQSYSEMTVADFDSDGEDELMTVSLYASEMTGAVRLIEYSEPMDGGSSSKAQMTAIGSSGLREGVLRYTGAIAGWLTQSVYGLVIDSLRLDGSYSSEMVCWDAESGELTNPVKQEDADAFTRTQPTESRDIDGDGIIEAAGDVLLPDCRRPGGAEVYRTDWYVCTRSGTRKLFSALMRTDSGYYFILPDSWLENVTAKPDAETRTLHFWRAGTAAPFTEEIMRIKVFTLDEWEAEEHLREEQEVEPVYTELARTEYYIYAVMLMESDVLPWLDFDAVAECFRLLG